MSSWCEKINTTSFIETANMLAAVYYSMIKMHWPIVFRMSYTTVTSYCIPGILAGVKCWLSEQTEIRVC